MKKVFSLILILFIIALSVNMVCFASPSANLLSNPGFENGKTGWSCLSGDTFTIVSDANSGSNAMKVTKPNTRTYYKLYQFPLTSMKNTGDGMYKASCYVKGASGRISLVVKLYDKNGSDYYAQSSYINLTSTYQYVETTFLFYKSYGCTDAEFYFQTGDTTSNEVIIDDCSLVLDKKDSEFSTPRTDIIQSDDIQVGAIRWDAYYKTSQYPQSYTVADQVARTLTNYQEQAPYFSKYRGIAYDVRVKFISSYEKYGTTYTIDDVESPTLAPKTINYDYGTPWETESAYAYNGSLDYFAYLWYKTTDNMSLPRKAHVAKNGYINDTDQLKMCAILGSDTEKAVDLSAYSTTQAKIDAISVNHRELYQAMASSCYLTVRTASGKMPILYFYQGNTFVTPTQLERFKEEARFYTAYLAEMNPAKYTAVTDIYTVSMGAAYTNEEFTLTSRYIGFDAISGYALTHTITEAEKSTAKVQSESMTRYGFSDLNRTSGTDGTAYSIDFGTLASDNIKATNNYSNYSSKISSIPLITTGYCCVPRIKIAVTWANDYGWQYIRKGTAAEIAQNLRNNLQWVKDNPSSDKANCVLLYAWNEHDEGGYLCPTAKVDENNQIIYDANGNATADTTVLDAVKVVIDEFKNDSTVTVKSQNAPSGATISATYNDSTVTKNCPDTLKLTNLSSYQVITLNAIGENFVGWYKIQNSKKYFISNDATAQVIVTDSDAEYVALYEDADNITVTFKNSGGAVSDIQNASEITLSTIPNMISNVPGVSFAGWMYNGQLISSQDLISLLPSLSESIVISAKYSITSKVSLTVNGEAKMNYNGQYNTLSVITVEAKEKDTSGNSFSYWKYTDASGDRVLSTKAKYSFYITADMTLTAVYGDSQSSNAEITVTSVEKTADKATATIQRSVSKDCTVVEQGVLLTKNNSLRDDEFVINQDAISAKEIIYVRSEGTANNGVLIATKINISQGDNWRFRGYIIYKDADGNVFTKYSNIK